MSGAVMPRLFVCLVLAFGLACLGGAPAQAAPQTRAEARAVNEAFLTGLAALNANRPDVAIPIFRRILARHPDLVRVRLELGRAYFLDRQWGEARREFELVLSTDIPDAVRRNVLIFIRRIDARRGFDWQLDLAVTELGGAQRFDSDEIDLNFFGITLPFTVDRRTERELGLTYDISARASTEAGALSGPAISTTLFVEPFAFGDYADADALRDANYGLRGGAQLAFAQTTLSGALVTTRRDIATRRFDTRTGVELTAERRGAGGVSVFGTVEWLDIDNHVTQGLDGDAVFASLGASRTLGGRAAIGATLFGERRRAKSAFDEYDRYGLTIFGDVEPGFGLRLSGSVFAARRDFRNPNPLFADDPDEIEYGTTLRFEKSDLFLARRFTPYVEVSARRVSSGISAFSFDERSLRVGVEKAF
jgi:hypothetical protein